VHVGAGLAFGRACSLKWPNARGGRARTRRTFDHSEQFSVRCGTLDHGVLSCQLRAESRDRVQGKCAEEEPACTQVEDMCIRPCNMSLGDNFVRVRLNDLDGRCCMYSLLDVCVWKQLSRKGAVQVFYDRQRIWNATQSWAPGARCSSRWSSTACAANMACASG